MNKRPKPGDDLLAEQEKFVAKNEPAAAFVKLERENGDEKKKKDEPVVEDNVKQVVFDVGERAVGVGATRQPHGHPEGFPSAFKLEGAEQTGPRRKKMSLFKQKMMARRGGGGAKVEAKPEPMDNDSNNEHDRISAENAQKLAQMSLDEIKQQQQELLAKLDAKTIEFLRKRRNEPVKAPEPAKKVYQTEQGQEVKLPIEPNTKWVNMKQVEPDKLEWMQEVQPRQLRGDVKIRVDFGGDVVNPLTQVSWREGLHHHGEDEQLAGYTLQELLGLANSRLTQQRMLAFDALAGVIRNARLNKGDRTLFQAPLLLLQAGLIVVVRRELDNESVQSQSTAINVLHALIAQLTPSDVDVHYPRGSYLPFDAAEAESLGDGLIGHSAKDLISALSHMNIHARFRFLLANRQLHDQSRRQLVDIITIFAAHSLTIATQLYEERIAEAILELPAEFEPQILSCLNEMAKHGSNLARRIFELDRLSLSRALFEHNHPARKIGIIFLANLLRLNCAFDHTSSMLPRLVENGLYHPILVAYFSAAPKDTKHFEQLAAIVRSMDRGDQAHLAMLTILMRFGAIVEQKHYVAELVTDLLPRRNYQSLLANLASAETKSNQVKLVKCKPLPLLITDQAESGEAVALFNFLATLFDIDKVTFIEFIDELDLVDFLTRITPKLNPQSESLIAALVALCTRLIASSLDAALIAAAHECGLRACLLLSTRHCALQFRYLSAFFTGTAFQAGIDEKLDIFEDMAILRGFILSITKELISSASSQRSEAYCKVGVCETLSFGDSNGSLPVDLPFYTLIELGTVYSSPEHQGQIKLESKDETVRQLIPQLRLIQYLLNYRSNALVLSGPAVFVRLIGLFLAPPEISHDKAVIGLIQPLLTMAVKKTTLVQNVTIPISGVPSFTDYFIRLLDAYEGHGYSLAPFAAVLLVAQIHSTELRLIVWGDRQPILRSITNTMANCLVPFDQFVRRPETNMKLVQLYLAALASKSVTYSRNEALYCFALFHVNHFIFDLSIKQEWRERILQLVLSAEKPIREEIIYFDHFDGSRIINTDQADFDAGKRHWIRSIQARK